MRKRLQLPRMTEHLEKANNWVGSSSRLGKFDLYENNITGRMPQHQLIKMGVSLSLENPKGCLRNI